jgi:16S rRNA (guanine966-N2)-methyltransferase
LSEIRITGGELGGRPIYVPKTGVRPTTGKVREALFSMLGSVEGARVLDLFCGSGALGIEALSRGALEATFVDKRTDAVRRNLDDLGISDPDSRWGWRVVKSDVQAYLQSQPFMEPGDRYDMVLCNPPYTLAADLVSGLDLLIPDSVTQGGRVVIETSSRKPLSLSMNLIKERDYGDTLIRIYGGESR